MTLKTYRARTMGDALAEVKKDLGKGAVILHTRTYKVGGWFGFGGKPVVEITASDGVNVAPPKARRVPAPAARAYGATPMVEPVSRPEPAPVAQAVAAAPAPVKQAGSA